MNPADMKKIVMSSVTGLGKLGGNDKFDPKAFATIQKSKFPDNKEFSKTDTIQLITHLVSKTDGKEN